MANSLFLPYVMDFNRTGNEVYYARIARQLGVAQPDAEETENAMLAVRYVEQLVIQLEIPSFADFPGVDPADFEDLCGGQSFKSGQPEANRESGLFSYLAGRIPKQTDLCPVI